MFGDLLKYVNKDVYFSRFLDYKDILDLVNFCILFYFFVIEINENNEMFLICI